MTITEAIQILKPEVHTVEALKASYRTAAKLYHPDVNPHGAEMMKLVNAAYELLQERFLAWTVLDSTRQSYAEEQSIDQAIMEIFQKLRTCNGLKAEVCGTWLWVSGNTRVYAKWLKGIGLKWSANKSAWYWHPDGYRKRGRKNFDLDDIRSMFGSMDLHTEPACAIG